MDAENTHQVFEWLWTSGQLSPRDIAALPALGVEVVVNLALPTSPNALPDEASLVTAQGLTYVPIPVIWEKPEPADLARFFDVLASRGDRKVWVHCAKNMRVSAFVYLYRRLRLGEEHEIASFPMAKVWTPNEVWQAFIDEALGAAPSI